MVLAPLPYEGASPAPSYIGTRIIVIRHKTPAIAKQDNVAVSPQIPTPCVIREFHYVCDATSDGATNSSFDVYLSNNNSHSTDEASLGLKLTDHALAGTDPPDWTQDSPRAMHAGSGGRYGPFSLYVPVSSSPTYLKSIGRSNTATARHFELFFVVWLLSSALPAPGGGILPRGVPEDPVCVRICEPYPAAPPAAPGPQPPAPAPPPEAPAPLLQDPFADPLPDPCPIDAVEPLSSAIANCAE